MVGVVSKKKRKDLLVSSSRAGRDRACTWLSLALILTAFAIRVFVLEPAKGTTSAFDVTSKQWKSAEDINDDTDDTVVLPKPERQFLATDPTGLMANDIVSVEHVPEDAIFVVTLNRNGRCPTPYLRGRLSGPALVLIDDWVTTTAKNKNPQHSTTLVGHYHQVPVTGLYFVEIIVIMCHDFSNDDNFDFQQTCVEDPLHNHRLLKSNVKVVIETTIKTTTTTSSLLHNNNKHRPTMGYWMHQTDERVAEQDFTPVLTRFQPRGCLRIDDPSHSDFFHPPKHCVEPTNLHRFEPYTQNFQYTQFAARTTTTTTAWWEGPHKIRAVQPTTLCLVGGSHSRTLKASLVQHFNFTMARNNLQVEWIKANLPRDVNNKTIVHKIVGRCDSILFAVGQWSASFSGNKPALFRDYNLQIRKLLNRLQVHTTSTTTGSVQIWARSIHDNPLNERIAGYCPPKDWRSPTVLAGYNRIIKKACQDYGVRFVSSQFIVGPLWDASSDWGHVLPLASHVEALYLVAVVLGLVEPNTG
ncbi:expressed unknown protein [Seminavis robusta]|uniref:Uncharacterized protein n=1 Tax=Seminavis robusta TaxID=568900 RepID=A0A9N8DKQ9_9STRA|nr:expressed unknown protein [Seminavis robusta]|eukprot:Sro208_g087150.1 n/a (526) ;mRNA; r:69589-71166